MRLLVATAMFSREAAGRGFWRALAFLTTWSTADALRGSQGCVPGVEGIACDQGGDGPPRVARRCPLGSVYEVQA